MKSLRLVVPLLIAALSLSLPACGGGDATTGPGPAAPPPPAPPPPPPPNPDRDADGILNEDDACPDQPETFNGVFDADGCPDTLSEFYGVVRGDVEAFWDGQFTASALTYIPISVFQAFINSVATACGVLQGAAWYCALDAGVYFESNFMESAVSLGDAAAAFIFSHEIGHHVGFQLGWWPPLISNKGKELQADCFGGTWIRNVQDRGFLESGDLEEVVGTLILIGDPNNTWFDPNGHGTPLQRLAAFAIGFDEGAGGCTSLEFFALFPEEGVEHPGLE